MKIETISDRIKNLRVQKGYTQRETASALGIPFNTFAGYELYKSRRIPNKVLESIALLFDTNIEFLQKGPTHSLDVSPFVIYVDNDSKNDRIAYVPFAAQAGYVKHYNEVNYLGQLATYSIPGFTNAHYRMFPVEGDSMIPTFCPGDTLICLYIEHSNYIKDGECYVIVSTEGICVKRCINALEKRRAIIIESDNAEYKPDIIPIESVREIWQPKARITKT